MQRSDATLRSDVNNILIWTACLAILSFWPFLSAVPAFTVLGQPDVTLRWALALMLFSTGFWAIAVLYLGYRWLLAAPARELAPELDRVSRRRWAVRIAIYASLWTTAYFANVFFGP